MGSFKLGGDRGSGESWAGDFFLFFSPSSFAVVTFPFLVSMCPAVVRPSGNNGWFWRRILELGGGKGREFIVVGDWCVGERLRGSYLS